MYAFSHRHYFGETSDGEAFDIVQQGVGYFTREQTWMVGFSYSILTELMRKIYDDLANGVGDVSKGRYDWRILRISTACLSVGAE